MHTVSPVIDPISGNTIGWAILTPGDQLAQLEHEAVYDTEEDAREAYVIRFGHLPPTEEEIAKFG